MFFKKPFRSQAQDYHHYRRRAYAVEPDGKVKSWVAMNKVHDLRRLRLAHARSTCIPGADPLGRHVHTVFQTAAPPYLCIKFRRPSLLDLGICLLWSIFLRSTGFLVGKLLRSSALSWPRMDERMIDARSILFFWDSAHNSETINDVRNAWGRFRYLCTAEMPSKLC